MTNRTPITAIRTLLVFLLTFTAQNTLSQALHPVKDNIACLWGLKNDSGKWVIPPTYTQMIKNYGGVFIAVYNEKWGVLNPEGKTTLPFEYDNLKPDSYLNGQHDSGAYKIYAIKNGKAGVVDVAGNIRIPSIYDELWKEPYTDLFFIKRDKKLGIRDYRKELLPCKFTTLGKSEYADLYVAGTGDSVSNPYRPFSGKNVGIINLKGDTIVPFHFKEFRFPQRQYGKDYGQAKYSTAPLGPLIVAVANEGMGLYTFEGKCLLEPRHTISIPPVHHDADITYRQYNFSNNTNIHSNEPLLFTENGKQGIVFPGKGVIQPAAYESIILQVAPGKRPALFLVSKNGKQGLLNEDGTDLLACQYEYILFYFGRIIVSEKEDHIREYDWRKKQFQPRIYRKILRTNNSQLVLLSSDSIFAIQNDKGIHPCEVVAHLPGDIRMLNDHHSAIAGTGSAAESVHVERIGSTNTMYLAMLTKSAVLLCDMEYKVIVHSDRYTSFEAMDGGTGIIVTTKTGKEGMVNSKGKLVVDTIFENIIEYPKNRRLFVKPLSAEDNEAGEYNPGGWAVADSAGKLLTKPDVFLNESSNYNTCLFLKTERGAGVFDFEKGKFIVPPLYKNGFVTANGDILMQTKDGHFVPYSGEGKKLSPGNWAGLIHISGNRDAQRYTNGFNKDDFPLAEKTEADKEEDSGEAFSQSQDEWLLVNGNSLALLNKGELIYDKRFILDRAYNCFLEAEENDVSDWYSRYFDIRPRRYSHDCPRLKTDDRASRRLYYTGVLPGAGTPGKAPGTKLDSIAVNDSLVMRMIHEIAPKARYTLYPKKEYDDEDERQEQYYNPSSYYYRTIYRNQNLISLQILDDYGYAGSSVNKHYFNRSVYKNYRITKEGWKLLKLAHLFKPGYETLLNAELVIAIQKADSLEMDCNNPASFLRQCDGRFSFSPEGLLLYLEGNDGYEFISQLIPWQRIKSIIPKTSAAFAFIKTE